MLCMSACFESVDGLCRAEAVELEDHCEFKVLINARGVVSERSPGQNSTRQR